MRRVAFLSMPPAEGWYIYDELLVAPLKARGWQVATVNWHDYKSIDWTRFEVVVTRSTWDYQEYGPRFFEALLHIANAGKSSTAKSSSKTKTILENDFTTQLWNAQKTYMRDLARDGVTIIPSVFLAPPAPEDNSAKASNNNSDSSLGTFINNITRDVKSFGTFIMQSLDLLGGELVLKPIVSASSFGTYRVSKEDAEKPFLFVEDPAIVQLRNGKLTEFSADVEARRDLKTNSIQFASKIDFLYEVAVTTGKKQFMVQPFVNSIMDRGEYSLFFFAGKLSHTMLKIPAKNDFRVQEEYNAVHHKLTLSELPPRLVKKANEIFDRRLIPTSRPEEHPLYCRADFVCVPKEVLALCAPDKWPGSVSSSSSAATNDDDRDDDNFEFAVIELELIEPSLYFNLASEGVTNFVEAFVARYGEGLVEKQEVFDENNATAAKASVEGATK